MSQRSKVAAKEKTARHLGNVQDAAVIDLWDSFQACRFSSPEFSLWRIYQGCLKQVKVCSETEDSVVFENVPRCCNLRSLRHFLKLPMFFSSILSLAHFPRLFETRRLKAAAKQKTSWHLGNVSAAATFDLWGVSYGRSAPSFYCSLRSSRRLRVRRDCSAPTSTTHTHTR